MMLLRGTFRTAPNSPPESWLDGPQSHVDDVPAGYLTSSDSKR